VTKEEFERAYARRSGMTTQTLRSLGLHAVHCKCGEEGCLGWQMASHQTIELMVQLGELSSEEAADMLEGDVG